MQRLLASLFGAMRVSAVTLALLIIPIPLSVHAEPFMIALNDTRQQTIPTDVIDAAAQTGQFTLFLSAVEAAGMEDTLRGQGPFTIFAPTDSAFTPRDQHELERLMRPSAHDELIAFVSYHIVPERVSRATLRGRILHMQAASGRALNLDAHDGLRVNDQLVVMPDIEAGNGYVQGMNAVLYPPVLLSQR